MQQQNFKALNLFKQSKYCFATFRKLLERVFQTSNMDATKADISDILHILLFFIFVLYVRFHNKYIGMAEQCSQLHDQLLQLPVQCRSQRRQTDATNQTAAAAACD